MFDDLFFVLQLSSNNICWTLTHLLLSLVHSNEIVVVVLFFRKVEPDFGLILNNTIIVGENKRQGKAEFGANANSIRRDVLMKKINLATSPLIT